MTYSLRPRLLVLGRNSRARGRQALGMDLAAAFIVRAVSAAATLPDRRERMADQGALRSHGPHPVRAACRM
jgi:hypothetical protein